MGIENDTRHREYMEFNENRENRKEPSRKNCSALSNDPNAANDSNAPYLNSL